MKALHFHGRADAPGPMGDGYGASSELGELKRQIHQSLMARIDPSVAIRLPRPRLHAAIRDLIAEIAKKDRVRLNSFEEAALASEITDDMIGLGPLQQFLEDDEITDILVNGPFVIYVERKGILKRTDTQFRDLEHLVNVAQRIAAAVGRRVDEASPMVDARLPDGSRVNIVLSPLVLNGCTISIRKFAKRTLTLETMVEQASLTPAIAQLLKRAAGMRLNVLISGGTGSGKTTLLNAISCYIDPGERIVTIEDAVELNLQQPHVVQMETRTPNIEGVGQVRQRELVRNALRMRPDRIILGEVRGAEAFDMMQAMNTGHDGSMCTIHANSARDALSRIENMVLMSDIQLPLRVIRMQIASALNLIVHTERMRDGARRVQNVITINGIDGDTITTRDLNSDPRGGERWAADAGAFRYA